MVDTEKFLQDAFKHLELQCIGPVALRFRRIVMNFQEDAIDPCCNGCSSEHRDEFRLAPADTVTRRGRLYGVRPVEDDWCELPHDGQTSHVDYKVVVAEAGTTFAQADPSISALTNFCDGMFHIARCDKLTFFYVEGAACFRRRDQQIGLPAKERGDLNDKLYVTERVGQAGTIFGRVDVREDSQARVLRNRP